MTMSSNRRRSKDQLMLNRRGLLKQVGVSLAACGWAALRPSFACADAPASETSIREFLKPLLLARADVDDWLAGKEFPFCKYDAELGYLHIDRDFKEGVGGAICQYRYDRLDARRMANHADKPCRINTYGDSFTSCEQVSDGETWQEVLAAHLCEPVRNYGIGGYSVYQAYLRMR